MDLLKRHIHFDEDFCKSQYPKLSYMKVYQPKVLLWLGIEIENTFRLEVYLEETYKSLRVCGKV